MQTTEPDGGSATSIEAPRKGGALDTLAKDDQNYTSHISSGVGERRKYAKRARAKYISVPLAVRLAELRSELEKSYRNSVYCSSVIVQEDDHMRTHYCGNRWCLVCNRIRTARAINAYHPIIAGDEAQGLTGWAEPVAVTLTMRNCVAADLEQRIEDMQSAFQSCYRGIRRTDKLEFVAVKKLECTYSVPRDDYHPHYHVIVDGRDVAECLVSRWLSWWGGLADRRAQHVAEADEGSLLELFKYFTKLTTKSRDGRTRQIAPVEALDVIFCAMHRRHVWRPYGFRLSDYEEELIEGDEIKDLERSPAFKRVGEKAIWDWVQDLHDWVDKTTGEALSEYEPGERFSQFVESID